MLDGQARLLPHQKLAGTSDMHPGTTPSRIQSYSSKKRGTRLTERHSGTIRRIENILTYTAVTVCGRAGALPRFESTCRRLGQARRTA
eukprot:scaffold104659_cov27-Tisochrysis_lutea.AAC.2